MKPNNTLIEVEIPSSKQPGDSTSAILTLCIGSGIEEICEEFDVTIFASNTATDIPHIRTVPTSGLIWDIETNYDGSTKVGICLQPVCSRLDGIGALLGIYHQWYNVRDERTEWTIASRFCRLDTYTNAAFLQPNRNKFHIL